MGAGLGIGIGASNRIIEKILPIKLDCLPPTEQMNAMVDGGSRGPPSRSHAGAED